MRNFWVLIIAVCCLAPMAHADDASKRAKSEQLVALMHMDKMMGQMVDAVKAQIDQAMNQSVDKQSMTPKQQAIMQDFQQKAVELVTSYMSWDVMKPDIVNVYVQTLSDEEMDGMIKFYSSPVGQSVLAKMPQIMKSSMTMTQTRMVSLQPKMKALVDEYVAKMKAASN
jgi:hypothetical protein